MSAFDDLVSTAVTVWHKADIGGVGLDVPAMTRADPSPLLGGKADIARTRPNVRF
jgi:hypothetical protein